MKKGTVGSVVQNLKGHICFLFSLAALLCLLIQPSLLTIAGITVVFLVAAVCCACSPQEQNQKRPAQLPCFIAAFLAVWLGFNLYSEFQSNWMDTGYAAAVATRLAIVPEDLLESVGRLGFAGGFYALYSLILSVILWCGRTVRTFICDHLEDVSQRLLFLISAISFFLLEWTEIHRSPWVAAFIVLAAVVFAVNMKAILDQIIRCSFCLRIVSLLTAVGICWYGQHRWLPLASILDRRVAILLAVVSVYFVYVCIMLLWNKLLDIFVENRIFANLPKWEILVYAAVYVALFCLVSVVFLQTDAFYNTPHEYDIIYTSDSPSLVKPNAFLALMHPENDLRQPLFAVFAAPFAGIPMLVGFLIGASEPVCAILLNGVQIALLLVSTFLLAKMMELSPVKRVCFVMFASCTYTNLLFLLIMEQYIVACFWLILYVYQASLKKTPQRISLWATGGTLLTGLILLPFMSEKHPIRQFRGWLADMLRYGLEFIGVLLLLCRFDVVISLRERVLTYRSWAGEELGLADKLLQYFQFVRNCFLAPEAQVQPNIFGQISWQMLPVTMLNGAGVLLLVLAVASVVWNRNKRSSLLAGFWLAFSVMILVLLGWGTAENGLLLYALYFGWALFLLLFQLVEKVSEKLHAPILVPTVTAVCVLGMLAVNLPALAEMIHFGITYYPV